MPGDVGGLLLVGLVAAVHLLLQRLHYGRQQATQAQLGAFLLGEGGALVRQRIRQHPHPGALIDAHDLSHSLSRYHRVAVTVPRRGVSGHTLPLSVEQPGALPVEQVIVPARGRRPSGLACRDRPAALYPGSAHQAPRPGRHLALPHHRRPGRQAPQSTDAATPLPCRRCPPGPSARRPCRRLAEQPCRHADEHRIREVLTLNPPDDPAAWLWPASPPDSPPCRPGGAG